MKDAATGPHETIEAMRFLWTMVAVSAGVVDLVECELGSNGELFTCQNKATGEIINVSRPRRWTDEEERRYVDELDRALNGEAIDEIDGTLLVPAAELELATV
jgi:hypothetical protein